MMVNTTSGVPIDSKVLHNYFRCLVNHLFKILPMRENNEESLTTYMQSLQVELLGCQGLVTEMHDDSNYLTILSILQYFIDNPDCSVSKVKREVFRAISLCNKLQSKFLYEEVSL